MIALLGYGKTNQALLKWLNQCGEQCVVFDDQFLQERKDDFGNHFLPSHRKGDFQTSSDIPSPGIPPYHPLIKTSNALVSEYDFILQNFEDVIQIWVSGTNGKTTTTEMLEWILQDLGGVSGGNIGTPLATLANHYWADKKVLGGKDFNKDFNPSLKQANSSHQALIDSNHLMKSGEINPKDLVGHAGHHVSSRQIWILETSSFSLHYTKKVFPKVYLLLPLSEDHISWHGSFAEYIRAKLSPLVQMDESCTALIPKSLESYSEVVHSKAKVILYQGSLDLAEYFGFDLGAIQWQEPFLLDALLALSGAKMICGKDLSKKLESFKIGAHKMEKFIDEEGRIWVDDSKGTNVDATIWAVRAYQNQKIYLILGGDDKGADLTPLFEELRGYDVEIFGIGSNTEKLQALSQRYHFIFHPCFVLDDAMKKIHALHTKESVALLSPAASSLDQFSSYKERGELFQTMAKVLNKKDGNLL